MRAAEGWGGAFGEIGREHGFEPLRVEGELPPDLRGTLYRNGPGRLGLGGVPYTHWFDGDGAITAVRLGDGRAQGACRVIETRWLREERAAGRRLYRNYAELGVGWRRWFALPKNTANISVMPWRGQLLALWEAGMPIAVDPDTLETRGETTLDGAVGPTFSAHPHTVGDTTFNFGVRYGARFSIDLYAMNGAIHRLGSVPLPRPTSFHDFIVTPKYLIFFVPPVRLRVRELLAGFSSFRQNLAWEPGHGTEVIVVPLADPARPVRFEVPAFYLWHFVRAWEEGDGLFVDYIAYDDPATEAWFGAAPYAPVAAPPRSRYQRARIDLAARAMATEVRGDFSCEFPAVDPAGGVWCLWMADPAPVLGRFAGEAGIFEPVPLRATEVPSEPVVVPRADGGAWVLSLVQEGDASCLVVVDAANAEAGPVARAWFDHRVPFTLHGVWVG